MNVDKFNARYDDLADSRNMPSKRKNQPTGKKEKFNNRNNRRGQQFGRRRETEAERLQRIQLEKARNAQLKISIPDEITVGELATRLKQSAAKVVAKFMQMGEMHAISDVVDFDTAALIAEEFHAKVEHEVHVSIEERLFVQEEDNAADLVERPPVVVVMGHVDHGKTSILDAIRKTNVTKGEAGGITQAIGAYQVKSNDSVITFLDTPGRRGKGAVVEARLDKGQGPIATLLVQNGTLHKGDCLIAGTAVGRVRTMRNDKGQEITEAGPSTPVEITGLTEVPEAGELFEAVEDERLARELADKRTAEAKEKQFAAYTKVTLDNLFDQMAANDMKELPIIVKADVQGSAEAVKQSLEKISNDEVRVRVIHDVSLADASNAIIIGFNVRPDAVAKAEAEQTGVEMRMYRVIYDAINDVSDAMKGMLAPKVREVALGEAQVRQVYKISSVGTVAGCRVTDGKITRDAQLRLVRDGIVICEDSIASLKRFKDDAKEVAAGFECGITLAKFQDIKEGDVFECFKMEEYRD